MREDLPFLLVPRTDLILLFCFGFICNLYPLTLHIFAFLPSYPSQLVRRRPCPLTDFNLPSVQQCVCVIWTRFYGLENVMGLWPICRKIFYDFRKYPSHPQIINYDSPRGGVSVVTNKGDTTTSFLLIKSARPSDSGHYQCNPSNAKPKSVTVHVLNGK